MKLTIDNIRPYLLFECISGSRAYGLATEYSDTDIKGVFYLPLQSYFGLDYVSQINNETNDIVYYELGRFIELLLASNPNILELLNTPTESVLFRHPLMDLIKPQWFLTKQCINTFAHYAQGQINKARGLNKKIINPVAKELKSIIDFCYVLDGRQTLALNQWLAQRGWCQQQIGLVKLEHARDLYALYYDHQQILGYQGVMKKNNANALLLSSVPVNEKPLAYLSFNQDGYSTYCNHYHAYWQWVSERNEQRYQLNIDHGRDYDSKNMLHVFRLLSMALEIAEQGKIEVKRNNRDELLAIKQGKYSYAQLQQQATQLLKQIELAFERSQLPETVNCSAAFEALITMRRQLYCSPDTTQTD